MQKTKQPKHARAFIGDLPRLSREQQLELCHDAVAALDGVSALESVYESSEFDAFVRDLRSDEVAVIARLSALAEKKPKGRRPGAAFFLRLDRLRGASLVILDADSDIRSDDEDKWLKHVESTANKITQGRKLTSAHAKKMAAKRHAKRPPGIVEEWKSRSRAADHRRVAQHWRDPSIKSAEEAIATVPEEFSELRTVSRSTMERIFGRRTTRARRKS